MKTLFLSPLQPQNAREGGGGRGGIPASFPSRSPPPKQPFQPTPTPSPGSCQEVCEKIVILRGLVVFVAKGPKPLVGRAPSPGGPGPKPPGDLAHRPLRPGSRHSLQAKFLTSLAASQTHGSGSQNATITPSPLTLGGLGWFPKAELYSSMRGGVPSSLQHFSRWAGPQAPENLANKPLSPASRSRIPKMPRCSSAHEKPALLHRLISCAQSLQPSLPFLLRRNNKVQGARS